MPKSKLNKLGLDNSLLKLKNKSIDEDVTEYGEFISSFDNWMTLEEQKRNADYLVNIEKLNKELQENERWKGN